MAAILSPKVLETSPVKSLNCSRLPASQITAMAFPLAVMTKRKSYLHTYLDFIDLTLLVRVNG